MERRKEGPILAKENLTLFRRREGAISLGKWDKNDGGKSHVPEKAGPV